MCCITLFVVGMNGYSHDILDQITSTYRHRDSLATDMNPKLFVLSLSLLPDIVERGFLNIVRHQALQVYGV